MGLEEIHQIAQRRDHAEALNRNACRVVSEPLIERDENVCDRGRDRAPQVVPVPKIGLPALNHLGHEAGPEVYTEPCRAMRRVPGSV